MIAIRDCPNKATKVADPIYFRDAASRGFFMFNHLKREMAGFTASSLENIYPRSDRTSKKFQKKP
jgi:hypothetical protein